MKTQLGYGKPQADSQHRKLTVIQKKINKQVDFRMGMSKGNERYLSQDPGHYVHHQNHWTWLHLLFGIL